MDLKIFSNYVHALDNMQNFWYFLKREWIQYYFYLLIDFKNVIMQISNINKYLGFIHISIRHTNNHGFHGKAVEEFIIILILIRRNQKSGFLTLIASLPISRLWFCWSLRIKKGLPYSSKAKLPTDAILETMEGGMLKIFIDFTHFTSKILEPSRFLHVHLAGKAKRGG